VIAFIESMVLRLGEQVLRLLDLPLSVFRRFAAATQDRLVGVALLAPSATVLGIAGWLTPDPSGMGTHQQLGLGGCTVLTLTGWPCPMCGMTTTFSHLAHFHLIDGFLNQPFGLILFGATVVMAVMGLLDLVSPGRRWLQALRLVDRHETLVAGILLFGMIGGWTYKILMVKQILPWAP
jgi:Protein of unknown function (DUF2752)